MVRERGGIPTETLMGLRRRLAALPQRDPGRRAEVARIAELFGVSASTVYRALASTRHPKGLRRADRGRPRAADAAQLNRYCTVVAALKLRTTHGQGRKRSTARAIELLEDYGAQTPGGVVRAPKGLLKRPTVDRWLQAWGYDHRRILRAPLERVLAARHEPLGPEARGPARVGGAGTWRADPDAVQRRRRPQWRGLSGIPLRLWRRRRERPSVPVQRHGAEAGQLLRGCPGHALPRQRSGGAQPRVPERDGAPRGALAHAHARRRARRARSSARFARSRKRTRRSTTSTRRTRRRRPMRGCRTSW